MSDTGLSLHAPAKINLHLSVTGRRPDGYHLLETLMVKLDLTDRITLALASSGISVTVSDADLPVDERNLVHRAAQAFFSVYPKSIGVRIELEKHIPVAAGLGGGSSDAAAVLRGLNHLLGAPLTRDELCRLGLTLGADVPFFVKPDPSAWARGIGEILDPGPKLEYQVLLVNPGWPLSTAWVYRNLNLELTRRRQNHIFCGPYESSFTIGRDLYNDLETVVLPRYRQLQRIKDRLSRAGALGMLMTGSGPTVYGLFTGRSALDKARAELVEAGEGRWVVIATRTLTDPVLIT